MYCHESPSFGTNRCTIASVAGSPPSTWYSSAPATCGVLAKPARSPRYRPSSRSGFIPSSTRRNSFMIRLWPNTTDVLLCSARNTDGSGVSAPSQRGAQDGVVRPVSRPPLTPFRLRRPRTASRRARLTSASTQGLGEDGRVVAAPDAGDDAARGVGLEVLGALALDHGERDARSSRARPRRTPPGRSGRARRASCARRRAAAASTIETSRIDPRLAGEPAAARQEAGDRALQLAPPAAGDERVDRAARLDHGAAHVVGVLG